MLIKYYLLSIILLFSPYFAQSQTTTSLTDISMVSNWTSYSITTATSIPASTTLLGSTTQVTSTLSSTVSSTATTKPITNTSPRELNSSITVYSTASSTSEATDQTENSSEISESPNASNVVSSSMISSLSSTVLTASQTSTNSVTAVSVVTSATPTMASAVSTVSTAVSTMTGETSTVSSAISTMASTAYIVTTAPIATKFTATYRYSIESSFYLKTGVINDTNAINSVTTLVNNTFNLINFITILQIRMEQSIAKSVQNYSLLVDILFTSPYNNCNITCIENTTSSSSMNISLSLPLDNGTLVTVVYSGGPPVRVTNTTTIGNYPIGGSSPGIPAQLGMGLGISLIGILIIAEIIFLCWKYGLSDSPRREQYAMSHYE